MAQPAAILSVLVTANTKQANVALAKTQGQLAATSKTAAVTTASMKRLGTMAKWSGLLLAGGVALGLKKSVEEAREANKVMAQTDAVIKSTGGAAKVTAGQVAELAERLSEKAGIDDEAIQSGANLLLTFKNIRNEAGAGNKIFDQTTKVALDMSAALGQDMKSSAIQLGKALNDPSVGLTALRRVGVSFNETQSETIQKLFESGERLKAQKMILAELTDEFKGSARAQADAGDRLRVVFDNIAEDIGQKVVPQLEEMATKVSNILGSKGLTGDQKAERLANYFTRLFSKGLDALTGALPKIAESGARIGLKLAESLAKAFMNADILGKIFIAGTFIRLIGGPGALGSLGGAIGTRIGAGIAGPIAAAVTAAIAGVKFSPVVQKALFGKETLEGTMEGFRKARKELDSFTDSKLRSLKADVRLAYEGGVVSEKWAANYIRAINQAEATNQNFTKNERKRLRDIAIASGDSRREVSGVFEDFLGDLNRLEGGFKNTHRRVNAETRGQARDVGGNVASMVNAVGRGLGTLRDNTNSALKSYGAKLLQFKIETAKNNPTGMSGFQRGGPINEGKPAGDSVPALLERGEYVLNRKAVKALGKGTLDKINFGAAKRFAKGGSVTGDIAGLNPDLMSAMGAMSGSTGQSIFVQSGFRSYAEQAALYAAYLNGTGNLAAPPGTSNHESGNAADITPGSGTFGGVAPKFGLGFPVPGESWHIELMGAAAKGAFGPKVATLARVLLDGPAGPLRDMGQSALDKTWKGAKAYIASKLPKATASGSSALLSGSGDVEKTFASVAKQLSASRTATLALGMAGYAESGMRDLPGGDASSQGALQLLASTASGLGVSPHDEKAVASLFLTQGFWGKGGANKLAATGLPAHTVAQYVQGSGAGMPYGVQNYLPQKANAEAWMRRYGLQRGGMPSLDTGGRVTKSGLAEVHPGDVHRGSGPIQVHLHGPGMDALIDEVYAVVDGEKVDIAEYVLREGGRNLSRARQTAGFGGRP